MKVTNNICKVIGAGTWLNLAKAFDSVDHHILIKISRMGIKGNALKLFESCLINRQHKLKTQNVESNFIVTTLQGTILEFSLIFFCVDAPGST